MLIVGVLTAASVLAAVGLGVLAGRATKVWRSLVAALLLLLAQSIPLSLAGMEDVQDARRLADVVQALCVAEWVLWAAVALLEHRRSRREARFPASPA